MAVFSSYGKGRPVPGARLIFFIKRLNGTTTGAIPERGKNTAGGIAVKTLPRLPSHQIVAPILKHILRQKGRAFMAKNRFFWIYFKYLVKLHHITKY
jgi:hypothetical protein